MHHWNTNECAVFYKVAEQHGSLSNMAPIPLVVNGHKIRTSEALYQACRFPHLPDLQKLIIGEKSPMSAKMKSKPFRSQSRPDFDDVKVDIMMWCLQVKLAQSRVFADALKASGKMMIVEKSRKDPFWGAVPSKDNPSLLVGHNVLGQLLTELRDGSERTAHVFPPDVTDFLLFGEKIGAVQWTA